jgi:hypothetical protein
MSVDGIEIGIDLISTWYRLSLDSAMRSVLRAINPQTKDFF